MATSCQPPMASPTLRVRLSPPRLTRTAPPLNDVTRGESLNASRSPGRNRVYSFGIRPGRFRPRANGERAVERAGADSWGFPASRAAAPRVDAATACLRNERLFMRDPAEWSFEITSAGSAAGEKLLIGPQCRTKLGAKSQPVKRFRANRQRPHAPSPPTADLKLFPAA